MSPEATGPEQRSSGTWWTTLPGVLTGIAAIVTAVTGLLVALRQANPIVPPNEPPKLSDRDRPAVQDAEDNKRPPSEPEELVKAGMKTTDTTVPVHAAAPTSAASTRASTGPVQVDGVKVTIVGVQRRAEGGASFFNVRYWVTAAGFFPVDHNPTSFFKLVSADGTVAPVWASDAPRRLDPNGQATQFAIRFPAPTELGNKIVLRIGESHPVELQVQVTSE